MILKVKLPYTHLSQPETPMQEITYNYIIAAVNSKYKDGVDGTYRRMLARIVKKIDDAIESGAETIEIENADLDLLKNAFLQAKLHPAMAYNASLIEDAIEQAAKN